MRLHFCLEYRFCCWEWLSLSICFVWRADAEDVHEAENLRREPIAIGVHPPGELVRPVNVDLPFNKILPVQLPTTPSSGWPLYRLSCCSVPFLYTSQCPLRLPARLLDRWQLMTSPQSCRRWLDICPSFKDNHWSRNLPSPLPLSAEIKSIAPLVNSPLCAVLMNLILYSHQVRYYYLVVSIVLGKRESPRPIYGIIPIKSEVASTMVIYVW